MHQLPPPNHHRQRERATVAYHGNTITLTPRELVTYIFVALIAIAMLLVACGLAFMFFASGVDSLASAVDRLVGAIMRPLRELGGFILSAGIGLGIFLMGLAMYNDSGSPEATEEEWGEE